jgi:ribosomal protein L39E
MASGDLIGFVHSDDLLADRHILRTIMDQFKDPKLCGVYGDLKYVDASNTNKTIRYWRSSDFSRSLLQKGWMPPHPTLFLKKEIYTTYGRFNTNLKIAADYEFILRLFKEKQLKFSYLPRVITLMRVGGASNRSLSNIIHKSREDLKALRMNRIPFPFWVLLQKNVSKLPQWLNT